MKKLMLLLVIAAFSFSFTNAPVYEGVKKDKGSAHSRSKSLSRSLRFPVAGTKSRIKDKWGARRAGGIRKHKGVDIHARKGTPVVAISDGVITEKAHTPIGGKTLWLKSQGNDWTAYYAHLDKQYVKEGQFVRKGQVIGTVGNTGNARSTPPHLHFGIDKRGDWVNPLPYVQNAPKVPLAKKTTKKKTAVKKTSTRRKK